MHYQSSYNAAKACLYHFLLAEPMSLCIIDFQLPCFIARVLRAEILMSKNNLEESRDEVERAFMVIPVDVERWRLGMGTRREYYERGLELRERL